MQQMGLTAWPAPLPTHPGQQTPGHRQRQAGGWRRRPGPRCCATLSLARCCRRATRQDPRAPRPALPGAGRARPPPGTCGLSPSTRWPLGWVPAAAPRPGSNRRRSHVDGAAVAMAVLTAAAHGSLTPPPRRNVTSCTADTRPVVDLWARCCSCPQIVSIINERVLRAPLPLLCLLMIHPSCTNCLYSYAHPICSVPLRQPPCMHAMIPFHGYPHVWCLLLLSCKAFRCGVCWECPARMKGSPRRHAVARCCGAFHVPLSLP